MSVKTIRIGADRVVARDDHLLVISAVEMEDWKVRQHRHTLIRFVERTWRVAGHTTAAGKTHYQLVPWTPADSHLVGREIDYNAEYVARRDRTAVSTRQLSRVTSALRVVSPFIGFLPAHTKARLEAAYGVDPVSTTFQSVFTEFLVSVCAFALAAIGMGAWMKGYSPAATGLPIDLFIAVAVVAGVDGSVRYGRILSEERPPPGFYEWAFKKRRGVN